MNNNIQPTPIITTKDIILYTTDIPCEYTAANTINPLAIKADIGKIIPLNIPNSFLNLIIIMIKFGKYIPYIVIIGNSDESKTNGPNQLFVRLAP